MNQVATKGLPAITHAIKSKDTLNRLTLALGLRTDDEGHQQEAYQYASSVLAEIERNVGDDKKDLTTCEPNSIVQAMIDSARLKLFIDARQHCHLVKYGKKASIQIGYRGYVHKIKEHFKDCHFHYDAIMQGDDFKMRSENGFDHYKHHKADPLNDKYDQVQGVYVVISYMVGNERMQKVTVMSRAMIERIKTTAKQHFIWNQWYIEKAIAACIKRACKVHFAGIKELNEVIRYDNENNHVPFNNRKPEVKTDNPFETMNKIREEKENPEPDIIDQEPVIEEPKKDLFETVAEDQILGAITHAMDGITDIDSYNDFYIQYEEDIVSLSEEDRSHISSRLNKIKEGLGI